VGVIDVHDEALIKRSVGTRGVDRHGSERVSTRMAGIQARTNWPINSRLLIINDRNRKDSPTKHRRNPTS
jgi:hypothetical protein